MIWAVSLLTMDLITHSLTAVYTFMAFGVWYRSVPRGVAITISVLYLHDDSYNASPKAISGRTSYRGVRLEFLRLPQLIR